MKLFAIIVFLSATFSFISCKKKQVEVAKIDMMPDMAVYAVYSVITF